MAWPTAPATTGAMQEGPVAIGTDTHAVIEAELRVELEAGPDVTRFIGALRG